jgi:hypothetical protein
MSNNKRNRRRIGIAVLGAAAAALIGAGSAHADDFQISIDGFDLLPTAGNTATAFSTFGDMAIASGVGAEANANDGLGDIAISSGADAEANSNEGIGNIADATGSDAHAVTLSTSASIFDSSWASGTNTLAESGNGTVDTAVATGTDSEALAGGGSFDTAIASAGKVAEATGSSGLFVVEPAAADPAAATAAPDVGPLQLLFGDSGINTWTPAADASLLSSDPTLAATLDTSVDNFLTLAYDGQDVPLSTWVDTFDPSAFSGIPHLLFDGCAYACSTFPLDPTGDFALGLDYTAFASGLDPVWEPTIALAETIVTAPLVLLSLPFLAAA